MFVDMLKAVAVGIILLSANENDWIIAGGGLAALTILEWGVRLIEWRIAVADHERENRLTMKRAAEALRRN